MSMVFNDPTNLRGLVQFYERECGFNLGDISGSTERLKKFAADVNEALDRFTEIAIKASGTWKFDDSNHNDFPVILGNIVSGQRDYRLGTDGNGNMILDIQRLFVADSNGVFSEVFPVDAAQPMADTTQFTDGRNAGGVPTRYDKNADSLLFDLVPNYNYTNGIKAYVSREGSYFAYDDTTKKPGVPGLFHEYFYLRPALDYARRNKEANYSLLASKIEKMEGDPDQETLGSIGAYFATRTRDERVRMSVGRHSNK